MAVNLQAGEIVGIVIVVLALLAAGVFICVRCCMSMVEVADTARKEKQTLSRAFRQSIRRSFRRTANRAGELARRASFRGRAGSINRQRRRPPQRSMQKEHSDLHPCYLQNNTPSQEPPPTYSETMVSSNNPAASPSSNAQTLDVTKLPNTNLSPHVKTSDRPMDGVQPHLLNPESSYRPSRQSPTMGTTPNSTYYQLTTPTTPTNAQHGSTPATPTNAQYGSTPTTPSNAQYGSQQYRIPYNDHTNQSPSYLKPSAPNQQYAPSSPFKSPQYPQSPYAKQSGMISQPQGYDSRKYSANDNDDDDEAGFGRHQTRSRAISSGSQDLASSGMRDQYGNVYNRPQQSTNQQSPSHVFRQPMKSPVEKDYGFDPVSYHKSGSTSSYSNAHFDKRSRDSPDNSGGGYGDGYNDTRGQYVNAAYIQELPSANDKAPPPPRRGYSAERTRVYKEQYHQDQGLYSPRSHSQSSAPRSPLYPDVHVEYPRSPNRSPGSAYYDSPSAAVHLQRKDKNDIQADTFV